MPQTHECDYCGSDIEPGTGTMLVRTDGSTVYYCSSKCEKNADLGREARDLEWTETGRPEESQAEPEAAAEDEPEEADDEAEEAESDVSTEEKAADEDTEDEEASEDEEEETEAEA